MKEQGGMWSAVTWKQVVGPGSQCREGNLGKQASKL